MGLLERVSATSRKLALLERVLERVEEEGALA